MTRAYIVKYYKGTDEDLQYVETAPLSRKAKNTRVQYLEKDITVRRIVVTKCRYKDIPLPELTEEDKKQLEKDEKRREELRKNKPKAPKKIVQSPTGKEPKKVKK